jgi:glycosyltransferase involved in cell wall biosynthesis
MRNGVEVRRVRHYVPSTQSGLRRALFEASSLAMALPALRCAPPDAVIGVMPSVSGGVVARAIATRYGVPYGVVFQDLAGQAAAQSGIEGARLVAAGARSLEAWAARRATAAGIVAEGMRPYVESLGVDPGGVVRVRNWSRAGTATVGRAEMRLLLGWPGEVFVCLHAGNMGAKQGLENVIACARLAASERAPMLFVLVGEGHQRVALEARAAREQLPNLRFMPLQPPTLVASMLRAADALLINQRATVREMSLPSKLAAYFASGRPVVAAVAPGSETEREVRASGGGLAVAPEDPAALMEALAYLRRDARAVSLLGANGQAWAREALSEEAALRQYEGMLEMVMSGRGAVLARRPRAKVEIVGNGAGSGSGPRPTAEDGRPTFKGARSVQFPGRGEIDGDGGSLQERRAA